MDTYDIAKLVTPQAIRAPSWHPLRNRGQRRSRQFARSCA